MPKNTDRFAIGGFSFENEDEAEQAQKEVEGIKYIKTKTDMDNPKMVLQVYNKMIEQKLFETAVGYSYLKDIQEYLVAIPYINNEEILPIPVTHPRLEESLKKQKKEIAQRERIRLAKVKEKEKRDQKAKKDAAGRKMQISLWVNFALALCIVAMFILAMTSESPTILNYQTKVVDKYASWEQELSDREQTIVQKEKELGITTDTE